MSTSASLGTWVDGAASDVVPADDRGLAYGDGLFETILVRNGTARFLEAHLARLTRGIVRLGIPFTALAELRTDVAGAVALAPPLAVLKIVVTRGSAQRRGYAPHESLQPRRIVSLWQTGLLANAEQGVALDVARLRVPVPSPLAGVKHLNRLENVLAAAESRDAASFEILMLDADEQLVSGASSNVFVVKAGELLTPPVDRAGVAGVMRGVVLREAPGLGIVAREQPLTLADVHGADGLCITNARIGVVPAIRVREHSFAMPDVILKLRRHIEALDA